MKNILFKPIDIAILVYFRIIGASLISIELINSILLGDIEKYKATDFHFSYQFFPWISPWPYTGMYLHYFITIAAGFMVAAGFFYRYVSMVFFLGFTSLFLMEQTEYINHTYLYCLITFWIIFMPLEKAVSFDVYSKRVKESSYAPSWCYYLLLIQLSLVYFYAGIAKINSDWLQGIPMNMVLPYKGDTFLIGPLLVQPGAHYVMSYFGLAFDLLIVPILLYKRTRIIGFALALCFHLTNVLIFGLATFPWFSIMMTTLFFHPSWPRKIPVLKNYLPNFTKELNPCYYNIKYRNTITYMFIFYVFIQILIPLRHWLYPGNVAWTEEGHHFSWRMMLRGKTGSIMYDVTVPETDCTFSESPLLHLNNDQYYNLSGKPELIIQYAHFLADKYSYLSENSVEVRARTSVSLNGHPQQLIVDPLVDLAQKRRSLSHYDWIVHWKQD